MRIGEKIKFMRQARGLSQEQLAEKLGLSLNGYANIERGETDVPFSRIKQIADEFEMDFIELVSFGERVVCYIGNENHNVVQHSNSNDLAHELEKMRLLCEHQEREIASLKKIIELLEQKVGVVT